MPDTDQMTAEVLEFYRQQSQISSPGSQQALFKNLPTTISGLCEVVQNLFLHQFWILDENNYGISIKSLQDSGRDLHDEVNLRTIEAILNYLFDLDGQPLTEMRNPNKKVVGNCRDYSVMLVSMLRHQGVPARVRSGVARYFYPPTEGMLEDHFICEVWNKAEGRWQRVDPQIDSLQRRTLQMNVDPLDLPPDQFLDAGESYQELKSEKVSQEKIGIFNIRGWPYVHYKLVSDLACVNSFEVLPWERWGICERINTDQLVGKDQNLLEEVAGHLTTISFEPGPFRELRDLFQSHPAFQIPQDYQPYYHKLPIFD
jgi:hypothetical protein